MMDKQKYWDKVYENKTPNQLSWTQEIPKTSIDFITSFSIAKNASIIDIGGGDSNLVDHLLLMGFKDITVLDISTTAINRAKNRLGEKAKKVKWIVSDITKFTPSRQYDVWHDRATFHFLHTKSQIQAYMKVARASVNGYLTLGTFSTDGPTTCSGLQIKQYSEQSLKNELDNGFEKIRCITEDHVTPFKTVQNFLFCSFKRKRC